MKRVFLPTWTGIVLLFFLLPTVDLFRTGSWYDGQRVGQVLVLMLGAIYLWRRRQDFICSFMHWDKRIILSGILFFVFGSASVTLSRQPFWGAVEFSLFFALSSFALSVGYVRQATSNLFDKFFFGTVYAISFALFFQFFVNYLTGVLTRGVINPVLFIHGFDNPRFLGQFCTMAMPLMAYLAISQSRWRSVALLLLTLCWTLAIASGTRGTWVSMAFAMTLSPLLFGRLGFRWLSCQLMATSVALLLFYFLFVFLPKILSLNTGNLPSDRITSSLSGRDSLWQQSVQMFALNPWVGQGPMHFADSPNYYGAHPHQLILQLLSEWGGICTGFLVFIFIIGVKKALINIEERIVLGKNSERHCCVFLALCAMLMQSMFDGVFVVPYTQLCFFLLLGWLMSTEDAVGRQPNPAGLKLGMAIFFSALFASLVVLSVAMGHGLKNGMRIEEPLKYLSPSYRPRFWLQGIIARDD